MNTVPDRTISAKKFFYRKILIRLFLGWLFLCLVIGGTVLWFEMRRVEHYVHQLALKESALFSGESAHGLEHLETNPLEHLTELAEQLVVKHFLMVEIYDINKTLKVEAVRHGHTQTERRIDAYRHQFPSGDGFSRELHFIDDELWLVTLIPLEGSKNNVIGYFEGVYQVDRETYASIRHDVLRTLFLVSLGISFTTLLMYPIAINLIEGVVRLSGELLQGNLELLNVLGSAIAARDMETNSHNYRVTFYALRLGQANGLSDEELCRLLSGAFLHDVGKIGIRDAILLKQDKLTPEEFEVMKTHVSQGVTILNHSSWLSGARDVVEFHHEKYAGNGYLQGLQGERIPVNARIFAIVDVFDALTSTRPYKSSWPLDEAIASLRQSRGSHFDPHLLDLFTEMAPELYREVYGLNADQLEEKVNTIITPYFFSKALA